MECWKLRAGPLLGAQCATGTAAIFSTQPTLHYLIPMKVFFYLVSMVLVALPLLVVEKTAELFRA